MSAPLPTRQQIDAAGDLEWNARRPARQELTIAITAVVNGYSCEITFSGQIEQLDALTRRLRELGAEPQRGSDTMSPPAARKPATRTTPAYDGNGDPVCPVHRKALQEGRYGLFCPSKAEGEHANAKGYCNIRFD